MILHYYMKRANVDLWERRPPNKDNFTSFNSSRRGFVFWDVTGCEHEKYFKTYNETKRITR